MTKIVRAPCLDAGALERRREGSAPPLLERVRRPQPAACGREQIVVRRRISERSVPLEKIDAQRVEQPDASARTGLRRVDDQSPLSNVAPTYDPRLAGAEAGVRRDGDDRCIPWREFPTERLDARGRQGDDLGAPRQARLSDHSLRIEVDAFGLRRPLKD